MMSAPTKKPRFHDRLVVRYALIMALTMLLFDQLSEGVHRAVFHWMGVPDSFVVGEGMLAPEASVDGGQLELHGQSLGDLPVNPEIPLAVLQESPVLSLTEANDLDRRMRRIALAVSWGMTLLISLLLGGALSWLVTSRLQLLTVAVAEVPKEAASDPPSLPPRLLAGKDELAQLARVFVESRRRISELLGSLSERDRTRREWIAHVSHDLRTPLTALSACLERAITLSGNGGTELSGVLAAARGDCERLEELTGDLLALARLEAEDAFTPEPVLAGELATRARDGLQPLADSKGLVLELDLGPGGSSGLSFDGDGRGILRVLENLLRNALEHGTRHVQLRTLRRGDLIRFEVHDDGPGFAEARDAGAAPSLAGESNGIGLRVARRFVELHGGQLEIDSGGSGTCVAFELPASAT